jgi:hypothetical protein
MNQHADVDGVVWTALASTISGSKASIVTEAVAYLTSLDDHGEDYRRAREYVVRAPPQIQTAVRREMRERGWTDEELPPGLVEGG